jgi:hypothetical protein
MNLTQSWWIAGDNPSVWIMILPYRHGSSVQSAQAMSRAGRNTCRGEIPVELYQQPSDFSSSLYQKNIFKGDIMSIYCIGSTEKGAI